MSPVVDEPVPGTTNLTRDDAARRGRLLTVDSYDVSVDLTGNDHDPDRPVFRSRTEITFTCTQPGASTFVEVAAARILLATLNGDALDFSGWTAERGLTLYGLAAENVLVVDAEFAYSTTGQGLHRAVDPADGEVYVYTHFEPADAQRVFACFDQPDLKAAFTWHATVPAQWQVFSTMPPSSVADNGRYRTIHFRPSPRMSTYVTALCAGPYHRISDAHDGIELGVACRRSMAPHLDAQDVLAITKRGFDFFHRQFDIRYPLPKYDQVFVPEFNAGAMENFGCVTLSESRYLFRSPVTAHDYELRANTILHELAHMWFGNLVTMRWWDDLWLKEAFAEWAGYWANAKDPRFAESWTTFLSARKSVGYRQDQLSSTHPVSADVPDVATAKVNFDGITYVKGASVIKQLVAFVGADAFIRAVRRYFAAHKWMNATLEDLLAAVERSSGLRMSEFAEQWLRTAQVNTLRPAVEIDPDGLYAAVAIVQEAPPEHPTLRVHRLSAGLYDLDGGRLLRRDRVELYVGGERTDIKQLAGTQPADVLLLNDDDLTYTKIRLDDRAMRTIRSGGLPFDNALPRALCLSALWDMVRDAELPARDFVALALQGLRRETNVTIVTTTVANVTEALARYADPMWTPTGWAQLARLARQALSDARPGGDLQLVWARAFIASARAPDDLRVLRRWLKGSHVPDRLSISADLRWQMVRGLVAAGAAGPADIDAELASDRTISGGQQATTARALIPTAEAKAQVWGELTGADKLPSWRCRALISGFHHPAQVELTAPYAGHYFAEVDGVWQRQPSEVAHQFVTGAFPVYHVTEDVLRASEQWLAVTSWPANLRRLVAEGRDELARALRGRFRDARTPDSGLAGRA